jgi:hypothetical protein
MNRLVLTALVLLAGCGAYERQKAEEATRAELTVEPVGKVAHNWPFSVIELPDGSRCVTSTPEGGIDCDWVQPLSCAGETVDGKPVVRGRLSVIDPDRINRLILDDNCWHAQDIDGNWEGQCTGTP